MSPDLCTAFLKVSHRRTGHGVRSNVQKAPYRVEQDRGKIILKLTTESRLSCMAFWLLWLQCMCVCVRMCLRVCLYVSVWGRVCVSPYVCVRMCVYMGVCVFIFWYLVWGERIIVFYYYLKHICLTFMCMCTSRSHMMKKLAHTSNSGIHRCTSLYIYAYVEFCICTCSHTFVYPWLITRPCHFINLVHLSLSLSLLTLLSKSLFSIASLLPLELIQINVNILSFCPAQSIAMLCYLNILT